MVIAKSAVNYNTHTSSVEPMLDTGIPGSWNALGPGVNSVRLKK